MSVSLICWTWGEWLSLEMATWAEKQPCRESEGTSQGSVWEATGQPSLEVRRKTEAGRRCVCHYHKCRRWTGEVR